MALTSPLDIVRNQFDHGSMYILATASKYKVFDYLVAPLNARTLAERAEISVRGAQALLDGLLALNLVERAGADYMNGHVANRFLVTTQRPYMGAVAQFALEHAHKWLDFPDAVRSGNLPDRFEISENEYWARLAEISAPTLVPMAAAAANALGIDDRGAFAMLDIGGGSGCFSSTWLSRNAQGRAVQLDCAEANRVAKLKAAKASVADRFSFQDGDLLEADFGEDLYDFAVLCNVSHLLSQEQNLTVLRKVKKALKTSGTLILGAWYLDEERNGDEIALLFAASLIIWSNTARTHTISDHHRWLEEAGFRKIRTAAVGSSHVLNFAEA